MTFHFRLGEAETAMLASGHCPSCRHPALRPHCGKTYGCKGRWWRCVGCGAFGDLLCGVRGAVTPPVDPTL